MKRFISLMLVLVLCFSLLTPYALSSEVEVGESEEVPAAEGVDEGFSETEPETDVGYSSDEEVFEPTEEAESSEAVTESNQSSIAEDEFDAELTSENGDVEEVVTETEDAPVLSEDAIDVTQNGVTSGTCGDNLQWTLTDGVLTISGAGQMYDNCFYGRNDIKSVIIGEDVTSIGDAAFSECYGLTSIIIQNGVTSIGGYAFLGCESLKNITIPNSVTSIGEAAFYNCTGLTSIKISTGVTRIGDSTFQYCSSLISIIIPNSVSIIGNFAFESCTSLTSITIPNSVTCIGDAAFGCCELKDVYYSGSASEWNNISMDCGNDHLTSATIHYNSSVHSFTMLRDNWNFLNSTYVFKANMLNKNYEISSEDYAVLCYGLTNEVRARIDAMIASKWNGSCFGMSASAVLLFNGYLNIENFDSDAENTYDATLVRNRIASNVGAVESMINYYYLSQSVDTVRWLRVRHLYTTMENLNQNNLNYADSYTTNDLLKGVVTDINRAAGEPVVLGIKLILNGVEYGGHAVIATDCSYDTSNRCYNMKIYDCSLSTKSFYDAQITVDAAGNYSFSAPAWEKAWNMSIVPYYAISADDYADVFKLLVAPGCTGQKLWSSTSTSSRIINTDSSSFTISDGVSSAVISDGNMISGNLDILCYGAVNEIDAPIEYEFVLADDVGDTITIADTSDAEYEYSFWQHDNVFGYYNTVSSDTQGTIVCGDDGSIQTELEDTGNLTMTMCNTALTSDWYNLEISGMSDGLSLSGGGDSVTVENAGEDILQISLTNGMNAVEVGEVSSESGTITMTETEDGCVVMDGNEIIDTVDYGYTVNFAYDGETMFPEQTGCLYGDTAECPGSVCKPGYVFTGWYLDEDCTQIWDFDTNTVLSSMTLYARLTAEDSEAEQHLDADGDGYCDICGEDGFVLQPGDFNKDLRVDGKDIVRLVKFLLGSSPETSVSTDTNHDGKSNLSDVVHLLRYMMGADIWLYG